MSELPVDPLVYDWPNTCRTCEEDALVDKRGYCSRTCWLDDMLIAYYDLEGSL